MGRTAQATPATPNRAARRHPRTLPSEVQTLPWAAQQLGIGRATAYRLAASGELPGLFRVGRSYRISVPRFRAEVHGKGS